MGNFTKDDQELIINIKLWVDYIPLKRVINLNGFIWNQKIVNTKKLIWISVEKVANKENVTKIKINFFTTKPAKNGEVTNFRTNVFVFKVEIFGNILHDLVISSI